MISGIPLFPAQASSLAAEVDNLYFGVLAITAFFALLVAVLVIVFAVKYRDETGHDASARRSPVRSRWSSAWSILPFIISMGIFVWSTVVFFHLIRPPDQTLEIYSTGKRWMWRFQHLDGQSEINELHVPKGRAVKVTFTSEDVLHSLYFPAFRVKADAIPGRYSAVWFTPTQTGEFHLFCAEYCGTNHSGMIGTRHRDGAGRLPGVAERKHGAAAGRTRRAVVPAAGLLTLSPERRNRPRPLAGGPVRPPGGDGQRLQAWSPTTATSANRS